MPIIELVEPRKKKGKKSSAITVVSLPSNSKNKKKKKSRNRKGRNRRSNSATLERKYFVSRLLAPSIFGPFRQPRVGASSRTGLAIDLTDGSLVGSATNLVQGLQAVPTFTNNGSANLFAIATEATALGTPTTINPGSQYPLSAQIADINMTACDIVVYYIGAPLNVTGEVIMGQCIPVATTASYSSLYFYPGTIKFPVADLIQNPKRISMRKLSPVADEFIPTTSANADVDLPFVFASGLPTGGTIKYLITRTYEYRSTTIAGSIVPYEKVGPEYSSDLAAFQDAKADVGGMDSTLTDAIPEGVSSSLGTLVGLGGAGAVSYLAKRHMGRARSSQRSPLPNDHLPSVMEQMFEMVDEARQRDVLNG